MGRIARESGRRRFGDTRWRALSARSDWRGLWLVVHAWLVIAGAISVAVIWTHPLTIALAVVVIGSRQLGLAILMHEAAHGLLLRSHRWNDRLGYWLCAWPVGISLRDYRQYHLRHHAFAQQDEDPDLVLSEKFPVSQASMFRKLARDLSGVSFVRQRIAPILLSLAGKRPLDAASRALVTSHAVFALLATLFGLPWVYLALWLLPQATWYMLVLRIRNIAEHACVSRDDDPWQVARTTHASWLARAFVAPYFVNYHAEHHLFMSLPCYRLRGVHTELASSGALRRHETPLADGYLAVLRTATETHP